MVQRSSLLQRRGGSFAVPLVVPTKVDPWDLSKSVDDFSRHRICPSQQEGQTACVELRNKWLGAFKWIGKVAEGTAGVVYRAERLSDKRDVAVKVIRTDDEELLEIARQEFEALKSLDHPCIVKVFDFFNTSMGSALVMDYFPGSNLKTAVRKASFGRFEESIAQVLFLKLSHAVEHMHRRGIIHRDIKAENVLVSSASDDVRLIDFNVAGRANDGLLTVTGTVSYMPPEVLLGDSPSAAGDIWALGLCLYLMLCGKLILERQGFTSRDEFANELRSVGLPGKCISRISEDISCECKDVLQRCLQADPGARATAHELLAGSWTQTKACALNLREGCAVKANLVNPDHDRQGECEVEHPRV